MRSDHLSKHIKTHQKGTRIGTMPTSSTDCNLDDIILSAEADQSDLNNVGRPTDISIGIDDFEDTEEDSDSEISDSDIASSGVTVGAGQIK